VIQEQSCSVNVGLDGDVMQKVTPQRLITQLNGQPICWSDPERVVHAIEGMKVQGEGMMLWPRCGQGNVSAEAPVLRGAEVTCSKCLKMLEYHS
jgi:hypothetical protein